MYRQHGKNYWTFSGKRKNGFNFYSGLDVSGKRIIAKTKVLLQG